jgi:uncharacterized membrane protein
VLATRGRRVGSSTAALAGGLALLAGRARVAATSGRGVLLGAGAFNLYDGIVQHKLLGLHQVRAGAPNNFPTIWGSSASP